MPWILLLISLIWLPAQAAGIPGVTTGATSTQPTAETPPPDIAQKKAAYAALADVLDKQKKYEESAMIRRNALLNTLTLPDEKTPRE